MFIKNLLFFDGLRSEVFQVPRLGIGSITEGEQTFTSPFDLNLSDSRENPLLQEPAGNTGFA